MKKRLILAILTIAFSISLVAQVPTPLWGKAFQAAKRVDGNNIKMAADGHLYVICGASTRTLEEAICFGADSIAHGSLYHGTNDNSTVKQLLLSKVSTEGQVLWTVYSQEADCSTNTLYMEPTSDGVVAFMGLRHTEKGGNLSPVIVDAKGNQHSLEWTLDSYDAARYYIGLVMKLDNDGALQWMRKVTYNEIAPNALAQDGDGNFYIGGSLKNSDKENELFLTKLDKDGQVLGSLQMEGDVSASYLSTMKYYNGKIYVTGYLLPSAPNTQVSIGGKTVSLPNEFATPYLVSLNTDLTASWAQTYESKKKGFTMQSASLFVNSNSVWLMGTSMLSLTTQSGKSLDNGDLTRVGSVLKFDITNGTLLDGYVKATDQTCYFSALEDTDGNIYAFCLQGHSKDNGYKGGPMWVDCFDPADLTAPKSTWENMIGNAANGKGIVYTTDGRLYTMTGSRTVPNALMSSDMLIEQTSTEYACDVCAFQMPITPVIPTAICTIEQTPATAVDTYYNLSGQRVTNPTRGIYICNGKKVVRK